MYFSFFESSRECFEKIRRWEVVQLDPDNIYKNQIKMKKIEKDISKKK